MRIAIVNEVYTAGATRCARDLEKHLSVRHSVKYLPEAAALSTELAITELRQFQPDVVHLHSYYGDLEYSFLARVSHLYPTCFTPHDPRPMGTMDPVCWECGHAKTCVRCPLVSRKRRYVLANRFFWERLRKRITHARCHSKLTIAFPSRWLQARFRRTELARFQSTCIPYGMDLGKFYPVAVAREQLGWKPEEKIILHVAHTAEGWQVNQRKGLVHLADAFVEHVLPTHPDAVTVVVGEGLIPNHASVRGVRFVPHDRLPLYYSAADVFATATLADNLPYTVLEAMACGTPVVASRVGGIPEEVSDGVTGYVVPKGDPRALGAALASLLDDAERRRAMGKAGRKRAEELFGMDEFVKRYEGLYQQVIDSYRDGQ